MTDDYEFEGLPLSGVQPGSTVLVAGPPHEGSLELGLRMLAGPPGEGTIVVTTNQRAARIAEACDRAGIAVSRETTAIVDCVGEEAEDTDVPARLRTVSSPSDLTGIGIGVSDVYNEFEEEGIDRVRTGIFSLSTLLTFVDLQPVSRFVHTLVGRIDVADGFGMLLVDPDNHDDRVVSTVSQFCSGRIDVREGEDGVELRALGLPDQPEEWTPVE